MDHSSSIHPFAGRSRSMTDRGMRPTPWRRPLLRWPAPKPDGSLVEGEIGPPAYNGDGTGRGIQAGGGPSDTRYAASLIVRLRVGFAFSGCGSLHPAIASSRSRIARASRQSSDIPSPGRAVNVEIRSRSNTEQLINFRPKVSRYVHAVP